MKLWYNFKFIDMRNFKFFLGYFNLENLFYWIIGNVGIVEIIEKFWNCGIHLHNGCVKKG